jgi:DNA-binding LacI/PurR family transcriptional regulator
MLASNQPTISDVAKLAGVSIATVSRVMNGGSLVAEETAQRVRAAIVELKYTPRAAARVLASRKTNTIGLLLPEISGAFFQPLLRGVEAGARQIGLDLLIHATREPRHDNTPQRPLGEHNTDGLLVFTDSLDHAELVRLHSLGFPVVLLHQTPPDPLNIPVVTIENQSGAKKIVEHLIEVHGCRRIAFLQGQEGHEDSLWREKGYRKALKTQGIPFDPGLILYGGFNRDEARTTVERMLLDGLQFDAIFAGDDDSALGAILALRQAGRRVPEDVAVAGFDDLSFAHTFSPPLTTVHAPTEQVGREAVHQLVRIIRGEKVEPRMVLPTKLVIRQSCGCQA